MTGGHGTSFKIGWIGGFAGGTLWILLLSVIRFTQGQNGRGLVWAACFLICLGAAAFFLPWRKPMRELRKLYFISVTPFVLTVFLLLGLNVLAEGTLWTAIPGLLVLYLPVFTLGKKTWKDIEENQEKF